MDLFNQFTWYRTSFARQIAVSFGFILFLTVASGLFCSFVFFRYQSDLKINSDSFLNLENSIYQMKAQQNNFKLIDSKTEGFYKDSKFPSADAYLIAADVFQNNLDEIEKKSVPEDKQKFDEIKNALKKLKWQMADIFSLKEEIGFEKYGEEGKIVKYAAEIENTLEKNHVLGNHLTKFLSIRKLEKDYLLRDKMASLAQFQQQLAKFSANINSTQFQEKKNLVKAIDNYTQHFKNFSLLTEQILIVDQKSEFYSNFLDTKIKTLHAEFVKKAKHNAKLILIAINILLLLQIVTVVFWVQKKTEKIVAPLSSIKTYAQEIGKGNLNYSLSLGREDEFKTLEDEMNKMSFNLKQLNNHTKMAAIGTIAATIAHDVNNPLTTSLLATQKLQMLIGKLEDNEKKDGLIKSNEIVTKNLVRINKIINGVRLLARDDSKDLPTRLSLKNILIESFSFIEDKANKKMVTFSIEDVPEDLIFEGREIAMSRVFVNLMSNAIDAVEKLDEKWVKIKVIDLGPELEISFIDSGPGIPEEIRKQLFKVPITTKPAETGTGLGLTICGKIINEHHGSIRVADECANTCFKIILPKKQIEALKMSA